jgi:addiction module HigA family antidote
MKNPPHPGRLVSNNLDHLGLNISEAAKRLSISRQLLHKIIAGRSPITAEMAVKLEQEIGSTADTWLRMQAAYDLAQVRQRLGTNKRLQHA